MGKYFILAAASFTLQSRMQDADGKVYYFCVKKIGVNLSVLTTLQLKYL
jgi:hypothetical protein